MAIQIQLPSADYWSRWFMPHPETDRPSGDRLLLERIAKGDEAAVAELYDRYGGVLYGIAYRITGETADAEEVVMEAFAQLWRDARRFEPGRGSVAAWLVTIGRSRALDRVRARSRRDRLTDAAARGDEAGTPAMGRWGGDTAYGAEQSERELRVAEALAALTPAQRQAIELAYYEGLSQSEIAERLNEPLGTIKTRVRLGMMKMRDVLRPFYYEPAL